MSLVWLLQVSGGFVSGQPCLSMTTGHQGQQVKERGPVASILKVPVTSICKCPIRQVHSHGKAGEGTAPGLTRWAIGPLSLKVLQQEVLRGHPGAGTGAACCTVRAGWPGALPLQAHPKMRLPGAPRKLTSVAAHFETGLSPYRGQIIL